MSDDCRLEITDGCTIWVCQGPPRCDLADDEAVAAQKAGCIWCKRIILDDEGHETVVQPSAC